MFRVPADAVDMRVPREYVLPRGWQAFAIVGLIPLWWLIGASFFMWPLIAAPLIAAMVVRGRILAPRRFGIWLLFILWVIASGVELSDPDAHLSTEETLTSLRSVLAQFFPRLAAGRMAGL